jgi:DNA-binding ferritin-like protein (Dps family)
MSKEEWENHSILNPKEFNMFFKEDFIRLSGFVAEMIYRRRSNYKSSKEDFRQWVGTSLIKLPEKLSSKYQSFILEYIFHVLVTERNWSNITAVALALIDEETLSYDQVLNVIEQNLINPVLK